MSPCPSRPGHGSVGIIAPPERRRLATAASEYVAFRPRDELWPRNKLERQDRSLPPEVGAVTGPKILYNMNAAYERGPDCVILAPDPTHRLRVGDDQIRALLRGKHTRLRKTLYRRVCFDRVGHCGTQAAGLARTRSRQRRPIRSETVPRRTAALPPARHNRDPAASAELVR